MKFKLWIENQIIAVPSDEAFVLPSSLEAAFTNIEQGRPTKSEGYPSIIPIEGGGYYIWDGYHRLAAQILQGQTNFSFQVEPIQLTNRIESELPRKHAGDLKALSQAIKEREAQIKPDLPHS